MPIKKLFVFHLCHDYKVRWMRYTLSGRLPGLWGMPTIPLFGIVNYSNPRLDLRC